MKLSLEYGSTDVTTNIKLLDAQDTTGAGKTGVTAAALTVYYVRTRATATQITVVTAASVGAPHVDGSFIAIDGTNMPGLYRFDLPDACFTSGVDSVIVQARATSVVPVEWEIELVDVVNVSAGILESNMVQLSNDSTAANNLEAAFDGTGGVQISADLQGSIGAITDISNIETAIDGTEVVVVSAVASIGGQLVTTSAGLATNIATASAGLATNVAAASSGLATNIASTSAGLATNIVAVSAGLSTQINAVSVALVSVAADLPGKPTQNSLLYFPFAMFDTSGAPATGLSPSVERSIDGGSFNTGTIGAVVSLGSGMYGCTLAAGDMNGSSIVVKTSAATAATRFYVIFTQPT